MIYRMGPPGPKMRSPAGNWATRDVACGTTVDMMEVSELLWELSGDTYPDDLREDGWLLVEEGRIVGATEFREEDTSWGRVWIWFWVYVDPEYRRKGVVTRRIPRWESQYPGMIIDQPNPHMQRLIHKTGLHRRCRSRACRSGWAATGYAR